MSTLKKELSLYSLTMIAIGSCIGSGIFLTPSIIANHIPSPVLILVVWLIGGLIAITGALTYAELGSIFPKTGGIYVFLKEAYGDLWGFLFGWTTIMIVNTGAIAALCLAFADYLSFIVPLTTGAKVIVAVISILAITIVNVIGIKSSEVFSDLFTGLKLIGIAVVICIGVFLGSSAINDFSMNLNQLYDIKTNSEYNVLSAMGFALIGVFFSYGGFQHASYVSSEVKDASRNVPLAMIIGVAVVCVVYLLANVAYLFLLPVSDIAASSSVAADAISTVFDSGGTLIALMIAISVFGTAGIYTLSAPRIYFAMAEDKIFFKGLASIHPKFNTPVNAILLQSAWAILMVIFWGTFENIITFTVQVDLTFLALAASSIFYFRKNKPDLERPYKTHGYPVIPLIFIGISAAIVINSTIEYVEQSIAAAIFLVIGYFVFRFFKKANS